ncbi:putative acyl-CoA transferases/carnitine dehydratase [Rubrobacter radiotolerans]|uniref:CoA transferase n=1 Tax=Rubrobacter radiotolerans TaxID=42256 RepID=A0A023X5V8_RUBRA|nr:CoA transferase [Rubrobacter radiotolerans]AHY47390.1 putative acyl-CoA transferases/carnitine dehydratase [Rubrobacter radiotolerans]MDX5894793.1 CoA transferase [Rubrobacter radiotolerans]SMC06775.1 Crotonobetainyl-CoA:carnitine CoA-transferase CaiB [Rubrobacter radiotolerans DSM 5868]
MNGALEGVRVVSLAVNVPGPVAAARLHALGAEVVKVEPPGGDPLREFCEPWYRELAEGQEVVRLDLKSESALQELRERLSGADLFLTSHRPAALARLGLPRERLRGDFPRLLQVAITGYPAPRENEPGHDLTYLAAHGLLTPPEMPRTLLADLAGAERAANAALAMLLERERTGEGGYAEVPLSEAAREFAAPFRHGLTKPGGVLGGGTPGYRLYRASDGWLAVAALEPHFLKKLLGELGLEAAREAELREVFSGRTTDEWETWAAERDLPILAVREA